MEKLTTTTNDQIKTKTNGSAMPSFHIVQQHEPLDSGPFPVGNGGPFTMDASLTKTASVPTNVAPVVEPAPFKVAIVGTAPSSRDLAPFHDQSWQIWSCSAGNMGKLPRVDLWVEIHNNLMWPENRHFGEPYLNWLKSQPFPILMADKSLVDRAEVFPKDECIREFGRYFFTSSFSWMMALAILRGAKEIGLWGVDMASRNEYILQRPGGQFFLQEAMRRGVKIHLPRECDLVQPPALYGFDDSTNFLRKINVREKELKDRVAQMEAQKNDLERSITYLRGALEDVEYVKDIWGGVQTPL